MPIIGKFISISKAAKILQVSPDTLRNWEKQGKIVASRTPGGARRYSSLELLALKKEFHPVSRQKGLLTISQAAQALHVSADTLRNWDKRAIVNSQRTKGRARRFTRAEVHRLQKELGIGIPRLNLETARFSPPWFKVVSTTWLMVLILFAGFLVKSYLDFQQGKTNENSKLIENLAKNIETLQRGVYGIQTQVSPSPAPVLPSISPIGLEIFTSSPITLDQSGEIGCGSCLTVSSTYISSVTNTDGTLQVSLKDKEATVSLDIGHGNTWSSLQTFSKGLTLEDNSNLLILGKGTLTQTYLSASSEPGNFVSSQITSTLSSVSTDGDTSLYGLKVSANIPAVSAGGVTSAIGVYASAFGADNNFAAIFDQGNVGIGTTRPLTGKLVISQGAGDLSAPVLSIESDSTVKFQVTADGSLFSEGSGNFSGGDLAEMYFVNDGVEEADVVELIYSEIEGVGFTVGKATKDSANAMLGVVSTKPGTILAYDLTKLDSIHQQKPVALIGRAPVKVSLENGPIEPGDYLTSSSTPGVAMKATRPGPVAGKALEGFDGTGASQCPDQQKTTLSDGSLTVRTSDEVALDLSEKTISQNTTNHQSTPTHPPLCGKILSFVNVSYNDPGNFFASLSLDDQGNLIVPKLKVNELLISSESTANYQNYYDLTGKIASLEERIAVLEQEATPSVALAKEPESSDSASLNLTPPDILLASGSAQLASLTISQATISGKLIAYDLDVSDSLRSFGETALGSTTLAGDLTVDGTLAIENGSEINAIGTLFLQKSSLAQGLDIFNGLVTIDKSGNLKAQIVTVAEFRVVANKISGSGKILAGTNSVDIENALVAPTSRILITPTSDTNLVLAVTDKMEGKKFIVSSPQIATEDIIFDWFIVNESAD